MNRILAACAALIMTASIAIAAPAQDRIVPGTLNVYGTPFTAAERVVLKRHIAEASKQMRATITVVITTDPSAHMREYADRVYDQVVTNPSRDIIIVILAGMNPNGGVFVGKGFVSFDPIQVESGYLYPSLRSRNYRDCINRTLDGILAQKA